MGFMNSVNQGYLPQSHTTSKQGNTLVIFVLSGEVYKPSE